MVLDASVCSSSLLAQLYLLGVLLQHVRPRVQHWWLEHRFVRGRHSPLDVGKAVHVGISWCTLSMLVFGSFSVQGQCWQRSMLNALVSGRALCCSELPERLQWDLSLSFLLYIPLFPLSSATSHQPLLPMIPFSGEK